MITKKRLEHPGEAVAFYRQLQEQGGQSALRKDVELKRAYQRLWVRKGNKAVAKVTMARRLGVRLYWMLREQ